MMMMMMMNMKMLTKIKITTKIKTSKKMMMNSLYHPLMKIYLEDKTIKVKRKEEPRVMLLRKIKRLRFKIRRWEKHKLRKIMIKRLIRRIVKIRIT